MNFDRISFRTSPEQRAFLERLNQRYRCRTITGLMRKILDEVMEKQAFILGEKSPLYESGEPIVPLAGDSRRANDRMMLKDTRMEPAQALQNLQNLQSESKPLIQSDNPYLDPFREIFWLEEARQKLERLRGLSR